MIVCQLSTNLLVQYILVGLIIVAAIFWTVRKIISGRKKGNPGCFGCALADSCAKRTPTRSCCDNVSPDKNHHHHEDNKNME